MTRKLTLVFGALFAPLVLADWAHADGKAVFTAKCQMCHKADGTGNTAMAGTDLTKATGDCVQTVKGGKNKMPVFGGKLTDAEIAEVCGHVKTFKK